MSPVQKQATQAVISFTILRNHEMKRRIPLSCGQWILPRRARLFSDAAGTEAVCFFCGRNTVGNAGKEKCRRSDRAAALGLGFLGGRGFSEDRRRLDKRCARRSIPAGDILCFIPRFSRQARSKRLFRLPRLICNAQSDEAFRLGLLGVLSARYSSVCPVVAFLRSLLAFHHFPFFRFCSAAMPPCWSETRAQAVRVHRRENACNSSRGFRGNGRRGLRGGW